jgi:hypothetical protein
MSVGAFAPGSDGSPSYSQHTPANARVQGLGAIFTAFRLGPAVSNPREGSRSARRSDPTPAPKDKVPRRWGLGMNQRADERAARPYLLGDMFRRSQTAAANFVCIQAA